MQFAQYKNTEVKNYLKKPHQEHGQTSEAQF